MPKTNIQHILLVLGFFVVSHFATMQTLLFRWKFICLLIGFNESLIHHMMELLLLILWANFSFFFHFLDSSIGATFPFNLSETWKFSLVRIIWTISLTILVHLREKSLIFFLFRCRGCELHCISFKSLSSSLDIVFKWNTLNKIYCLWSINEMEKNTRKASSTTGKR